jgi:uncharacterized short protein YbdD (DUF466 family)
VTVAGIRDAIRQAAHIVRRVVGVPDYDTYLAHLRECHPAAVPLTRQEFERARLEDRYSRPGQRCC